jgi:hypothetical protein
MANKSLQATADTLVSRAIILNMFILVAGDARFPAVSHA